MYTRSGRLSKRKSDTSFFDTSIAVIPKKKKTNQIKNQQQSMVQTAGGSNSLDKKIDSILLGIQDLTRRQEQQEQRLDFITGSQQQMVDSDEDMGDEEDDQLAQEVEILPQQPVQQAVQVFRQPSRQFVYKGKGQGKSSFNPRGQNRGTPYARGQGSSRGYQQPPLQNGGGHHRGGRQRDFQQQAHQQRPPNRGRGQAQGQHMSKSFRAELRRMMKQEILDEQYQGERASRQVIIYGEPSGEDDTKEQEKKRAWEKLRTISKDFQLNDIESTQRFEDAHSDGAFPMIVTIRRKLVVMHIMDHIENGHKDDYPWLDQSRTREVRRRNARLVNSIEDLNEALSKANSATLWEPISAGPISARKRIPNPNYIPPTKTQKTQVVTTNKRPKKDSTPMTPGAGASGSQI